MIRLPWPPAWMLLMGVAISLSACASKPAGNGVSPPPAGPASGIRAPSALEQSWSLITVDGAPVTVPEGRARPTLIFDGETGRVSGLAGVNRFGGPYAADGGSLKFGPLVATKMAGPPALNDLETRYLAALERTSGWRIDQDELVLLAGEQVVARFTAMR